jgi:alkylation response protein AidB-like acyl-CoA dehydrogenase
VERTRQSSGTVEPAGQALVDELNAFLDEHWSPDIALREWWARLADARLTFPHWPAEWGGRDWNRAQVRVRNRVFNDRGVVGPPSGLGTIMGGPVVIDHGTDEQKHRLLPPLIRGEESWCQLFSEPGAGSDLAGLTTRAERHGDEWIVNGQKVWTSGSTVAQRGMLVARTDWDRPKHQGISYFIIDMDQPGIEIRPLKQMNGEAFFSEVFMTDARISQDDLIGSVNGGWSLAVATLSYERAGLSDAGGAVAIQPTPGPKAGYLDRPVNEVIDRVRAQSRESRTEAVGTAKALLRMAKENAKIDEPAIRQELAQLFMREHIARATMLRTAAARRRGRQPGPEASIAKLVRSESVRAAATLGSKILGPRGLVHGRFSQFVLSAPATSIAGGTDEVQRNIVAERALGLPKDIQVDRDVPFREVKRSG